MVYFEMINALESLMKLRRFTRTDDDVAFVNAHIAEVKDMMNRRRELKQ